MGEDPEPAQVSGALPAVQPGFQAARQPQTPARNSGAPATTTFQPHSHNAVPRFGFGHERTGLTSDERMCNHECLNPPSDSSDSESDGDSDPDEDFGNHPERPQRIVRIMKELEDSGLKDMCVSVPAREVTRSEIGLVHTDAWIEKFNSLETLNQDALLATQDEFNSIYLSPGSVQAARLSAGSVVAMTEQVVAGRIKNGVCVVRPPGHHAEANHAMGFCLLNNVAIAARVATTTLGLSRVLIVDWDVHHGNGTQRMFEPDPKVLYFSIHRHDNGAFYPGSPDAEPTMVGTGPGEGYNVNVAFSGRRMGDADYLYAWNNVLLPLAEEYAPELVIISAGFDAACGDPLGGYDVSPAGYAHMTHKLMSLAGGKVVMALEGGYHLGAISSSFAACTAVLLGAAPPMLEPLRPSPEAMMAVERTQVAHAPFWHCLAKHRRARSSSLDNPPRLVPILSSSSSADSWPRTVSDVSASSCGDESWKSPPRSPALMHVSGPSSTVSSASSTESSPVTLQQGGSANSSTGGSGAGASGGGSDSAYMRGSPGSSPASVFARAPNSSSSSSSHSLSPAIGSFPAVVVSSPAIRSSEPPMWSRSHHGHEAKRPRDHTYDGVTSRYRKEPYSPSLVSLHGGSTSAAAQAQSPQGTGAEAASLLRNFSVATSPFNPSSFSSPMHPFHSSFAMSNADWNLTLPLQYADVPSPSGMRPEANFDADSGTGVQTPYHSFSTFTATPGPPLFVPTPVLVNDQAPPRGLSELARMDDAIADEYLTMDAAGAVAVPLQT